MAGKRREVTRRRFLQISGATTAAVAGGLWRTERSVAAGGANLTLAFWNGLTGPDGRVMEGLVNDFTSEHKNIKI
ncbi:MAG: ABC transporter substrate-binding protein, partial [Bacillati bacterium ANGP1]